MENSIFQSLDLLKIYGIYIYIYIQLDFKLDFNSSLNLHLPMYKVLGDLEGKGSSCMVSSML